MTKLVLYAQCNKELCNGVINNAKWTLKYNSVVIFKVDGIRMIIYLFYFYFFSHCLSSLFFLRIMLYASKWWATMKGVITWYAHFNIHHLCSDGEAKDMDSSLLKLYTWYVWHMLHVLFKLCKLAHSIVLCHQNKF